MIDLLKFPYPSFPVRLEIKDDRICWFKDEVDLQKHLIRHKIKTDQVIITIVDAQSLRASHANQNSLQPRVEPTTSRSSNTSRECSKKLDTNRNSNGTSKSKSKQRKPKKN